MNSSRNLEPLYLGLAVLGTLLPMAAFLPWLAEHGPDIPLLVQTLFANRVGAFFGWDVAISAIVILAATAANRPRLRRTRQVSIVVGTLAVGVSLGLPLYLLFLEQARRGTSPGQ